MVVARAQRFFADFPLAKAGLTHDPAADKVAQTRARFGLPRGAAFVTPDREAALVGAIRAALDLVYASKFAEAERAREIEREVLRAGSVAA